MAWTAHQLGQKAIIYMPKGSAQSRVDNIRSLGAECRVTELNYDDTVRLSWQRAQQENYVMVQDTAWDGYETIPTWIMQGYMTLALEALEQMRGMDVLPTHVFLQAGVGSFAGSIAGFLISALGEKAPKIIIVEPHKANCIYTSAVARDGKPHSVKGALDTLMAGLACGEANTVSWGILARLRDGLHLLSRLHRRQRNAHPRRSLQGRPPRSSPGNPEPVTTGHPPMAHAASRRADAARRPLA